MAQGSVSEQVGRKVGVGTGGGGPLSGRALAWGLSQAQSSNVYIAPSSPHRQPENSQNTAELVMTVVTRRKTMAAPQHWLDTGGLHSGCSGAPPRSQAAMPPVSTHCACCEDGRSLR